jgi:hypothetical protein
MKSARYLFLLLCLNFIGLGQGLAMLPAAAPANTQPAGIYQLGQNLRTATWGEKVKIVKKIRKDLRMRGNNAEGEKPSKLAWIALGTFAGYFLLSILASVVVSTFLTVLGGLAFLASLILAIVILATEDNRKSKLIAKIILITYGVLLLFAVILLAALIVAWGW